MAHPPTFFECFGSSDTWVLPAEVLDDTAFVDPETGEALPSLRQQCSAGGRCFAHISQTEEGLYRASVAATPDLTQAAFVLLTEEQVSTARPWESRLTWLSPRHQWSIGVAPSAHAPRT